MESYRPGLRSVVGASATAYGYTLTVEPFSMLLTGGYGPPKPLEVLLFSGGAILAFALVGALAFGGMTERFGDPPKRIQLWGSFHFLSVGLAGGGLSSRCLSTERPGLAAGSFRGDGHLSYGRGVRERCGRPGSKEDLGREIEGNPESDREYSNILILRLPWINSTL
jgi:hypothetical protein